MKHMIMIWLTVLIICSCTTVQSNIFIPLPVQPALERPRFIEKDDGLWLSYEEYRKLDRNIILMNTYIDKLKKTIEIYQGAYRGEK